MSVQVSQNGAFLSTVGTVNYDMWICKILTQSLTKFPIQLTAMRYATTPHHNRFTALFWDHLGELVSWSLTSVFSTNMAISETNHLGEPVPEKNFWTLWRKGRLTEADTPTIRLRATPSRLTIAHLHHPLCGMPVSQKPKAAEVNQSNSTISITLYCIWHSVITGEQQVPQLKFSHTAPWLVFRNSCSLFMSINYWTIYNKLTITRICSRPFPKSNQLFSN